MLASGRDVGTEVYRPLFRTGAPRPHASARAPRAAPSGTRAPSSTRARASGAYADTASPSAGTSGSRCRGSPRRRRRTATPGSPGGARRRRRARRATSRASGARGGRAGCAVGRGRATPSPSGAPHREDAAERVLHDPLRIVRELLREDPVEVAGVRGRDLGEEAPAVLAESEDGLAVAPEEALVEVDEAP